MSVIYHTYVLTIKGAPKSINEGGGGTRRHHMVGHKEKMHWQDQFGMELLAAGAEKGMQFATIYVTLRFKYKSGGPGRDVENYRQPVVKPLLDALVTGGYLKDDTEEWVRVQDITIEEAPPEWPHADPRVKSELIVKIEGAYA